MGFEHSFHSNLLSHWILTKSAVVVLGLFEIADHVFDFLCPGSCCTVASMFSFQVSTHYLPSLVVAANQVVPVFLGAAETEHGVRRLLNLLVGLVPSATETAARRGAPTVDTYS
mgnify:CR=1 FL=1